MAEKRSSKSRDSIVLGLQEVFQIDRSIVKAVLESENWNVEKCLKMLGSISPKLVNNNNKGKSNTNKKNKSRSDGGKSEGCLSMGGNTGQRWRGRNKQMVTVIRENVRVKEANSDPWVLVGVEKKADKRKNKSKAFSPAHMQLRPDTQASQSDINSKKKKLEVLKSTYSIIRQKGNPVDRIRDCIKCEIKIMVLMRGCPGSGKSTYARELLNICGVECIDKHIFSTDNYFLDSKGLYNYDRNSLDKAHTWNQELVEKVMKMGLSPVFVDNTHIKAWEMMCYAQFAVRLGYVLETLEPPTPWFFNGHILAKKNSHGVPKSKINLMLESYEPDLSGNDLFKKFRIDYNMCQMPPQAVNYSEGDILAVLKKTMLGKKLFTSVKKKSTPQNIRMDSTNDIKIDKNKFPLYEIVRTEPSQMNNDPYCNLSKANIPYAMQPNIKTTNTKYSNSNLLCGASSESLKPNSDTTVWSIPYHTGPGSSYFPVTPICLQPSSMSNSSFLQSYPNHESAPSTSHNNLIDKPLETNVGHSLVSPLLPESSATRKLPSQTDTINLDPSEFPTLSSSLSGTKTTCDAVLNNCKTFEEKSRKLIELFPHLDKEYITHLCNDSKRNLDDIVSLLLDSNSLSTPTNSADLPENSEIKLDDCYDSGSDQENDEDQNFLMEKDVGMLVQLFPNIKEYRIRESYEKFSNDFRVTLDFLLNYDSSEINSEINESEETNSNVVEDSAENPDNTAEGNHLSLMKLLKSLKDCGSNIDSTLDFSNLHLKTESVESDYEDCSDKTSDNLKYKLNNTANGVFDESCYRTEDDDTSHLVKVDSNRVSAASDNQSRFICHFGESDNQIVDCHQSASLPQHSAVDKSPQQDHSEMSKSITLDKFEVAMKNALTSLSVNYASPHSSGSSEQSQIVRGSPDSSKLSFTSKLVDWNFEDITSAKVIDKSLDDVPKIQRRRIYCADVQTSCTNTNYKDFESLKKAENLERIDERVLCGNPFNFMCDVEPLKERVMKNVLTLDKGTSTWDSQEAFSSAVPSTSGVPVLAAMFPNIPLNDLESLLGSCIGDLDWAVGLLLDDGHEISKNFNPSDYEIETHENTVPLLPTGSNVVDYPGGSQNIEPDSLSVPVKNKKSKTRTPVENINYVMNYDSISSHVRKLRNSRLGLVEPSSSCDSPNDVSSPAIISQYYTFSSGSSSDDEAEENEETLAIALSTDFILALQAQFGGYIPSVSPDNQVLVDLPVYLARQLHSCIMDSISQQLEQEQQLINKMIEEDECLARHLQEMENEEEGDGDHQPSIQEIMDQELALNIHKSLNKGKSNGDTVAGKLSRQLLIERFPSMDPVALQGILDDSDHSLYQATQLLEAAGYNRATTSPQSDAISNVVDESEEFSREDAVEHAGAYREAAKVFFKMRHECFTKAQQAYAKGDKHVASYYSQMANWHNERIEQAHHLASTLLLSGNQKANTLDLHFLRVREALQVLDLFLDAHISNIQEMKIHRRQLYIITGRGLHSQDGKAKIRPVTVQRLKQRSVWFQLVNPGLLMVYVSSKSPLAYQK